MLAIKRINDMDPIDHNKLIKKIAKQQLEPFGIYQKGQSRTFLFDRGWYTIIIEFQPSSYSKGTYLNVGLDFNFYPRNYFAFGFGYRENGFEPVKDEKQFTQLVFDLCNIAMGKVKKLDKKFSTVSNSLKVLNKENSNDSWELFDKAVLNVLNNNFEQAKKILQEISDKECKYDYEFERKELVNKLLSIGSSNEELTREVRLMILETRKLKKLSESTVEEILTENHKLESKNENNFQFSNMLSKLFAYLK